MNWKKQFTIDCEKYRQEQSKKPFWQRVVEDVNELDDILLNHSLKYLSRETTAIKSDVPKA